MLPQEVLASLPSLLPEQEHLRPFVSTVAGNLEFRVWREQLERIDEIPRMGQVEAAFVRLSLGRQRERELKTAAEEGRPAHMPTPGEQVLFQWRASQALRCVLVRTLTGEGLRPFARHLAESPLLQWFCRLDRLERVRIPSKSQLQRQAGVVEEVDLRAVVARLLEAASCPAEAGPPQPIGLRAELDLETYFLDSTCVKLNIHFPVDWVLPRDAARTLMKATMLIRKRGLKRRMEEPAVFVKRMNRLAMEMTRQARRSGERKGRKKTLRAMKKLVKVIRERRFVRLQRRRSQTEARIAIFKNGFLGAPLRVKGYGRQDLQVGWAVLTHNLWCVARQPRDRTERKGEVVTIN